MSAEDTKSNDCIGPQTWNYGKCGLNLSVEDGNKLALAAAMKARESPYMPVDTNTDTKTDKKSLKNVIKIKNYGKTILITDLNYQMVYKR